LSAWRDFKEVAVKAKEEATTITMAAANKNVYALLSLFISS
jgi:hypothetical protein